MIRLALMRHGRTRWNLDGRIQGRTDIPLEPDALRALRDLSLPVEWREAALVSSPLSRAIATAEAVTGRTPKIVPALTEMDWGEWEGQKGADLLADDTSDFSDLSEWGWSFRPPDGEAPDDVRARLQPWLGGLRRDTVAVTHIGVMRVCLAMATGWSFFGEPPFRIKRNRLYILEVDGQNLNFIADQPRLIEDCK